MDTHSIDVLRTCVSVHSTYPNEASFGSYIADLLTNAGCTVSIQKVDGNRCNILAEKGTGKTSVLLYAHLDTVAVVNGWKTDPFQLTIRGDKAYGLGVWDMKGGLSGNIQAFLAFQPKNIKLKCAFCVDEENISLGGHTLIKSNFMKDVSCVISPEPAFFYGNAGVVIGRVGRCVYTVVIKGDSRHFARYDKKSDINLFASSFLSALTKLYKKNGDKKQFVFARSITSQAVGLSIPEQTLIELDACILPPCTNAMMLRDIQKIASGVSKQFSSEFTVTVSYKNRRTEFLDPYIISTTNRYLTAMKKCIREVTHVRARPYFRSSVADENIFGSHGYTVLGIGAVGGNAHAPNEWISLRSLAIYSRVLKTFLSNVDKTT